jgi:pterin-4a-carbinolamine dehydratase
LLDDATRERLRQQVPGWRVVTAPGNGSASIQQEWTAKDAAAAAEMVAKVQEVAAAAGHAPAAVEAVGNTVVARLSTAALGAFVLCFVVVVSLLSFPCPKKRMHPSTTTIPTKIQTQPKPKTKSNIGGLTEADFIVAARVNDLDFKPLLAQRKQRFWA